MTVVAMPQLRRLVSPRLRRRQAADRIAVSSRLVSEASHPARMAHLTGRARRAQVARHYEAAQRHLRAAEVLLREGE